MDIAKEEDRVSAISQGYTIIYILINNLLIRIMLTYYVIICNYYVIIGSKLYCLFINTIGYDGRRE